MRWHLSRLFALAALLVTLAVVAAPARADLKIVAEKWLTGLEELNAYSTPTTYTYYYKGERYREESSANGIYYIYDCAKDRYYAIDREDESYMVMTLQEALTKRRGFLSNYLLEGTAKVEPGGSTRVIAGKNARNYSMSMDVALKSERTGGTVLTVKMEGEQWATDAAQISPKCQKILKAAYARGIFRYNKVLEPLFAKVENIKGVPLSYDMILNLAAVSTTEGLVGGTIEAHSEVKGISTKPLPASLFEVPKGYRLVPVLRHLDIGD